MAEFISLGMVRTVGMIESEMGYRAANPFTTQYFFLVLFIDAAAAV
jgi:hypothetical protein